MNSEVFPVCRGRERRETLNRALHFLETIARPLTSCLKNIALFTMGLMMIFITVGVIGRYVFNAPITGDVEIVGFAMVLLVMFGVAYTQAEDAHLSVKLVVDRLPKKTQLIFDIFNYLMVVAILGLISWRSLDQAVYSFQTMDTSDILGIPLFYFRFMVPLGFIAFTLEAIIKLFRTIKRTSGKVEPPG
jgi:TRAP-type C4-dicarboxylate transport system permease small subunit